MIPRVDYLLGDLAWCGSVDGVAGECLGGQPLFFADLPDFVGGVQGQAMMKHPRTRSGQPEAVQA